MEDLSLPLHAYAVLDTLFNDNLIDEGTYLVVMARMPHANASALFDGLETYEQRTTDDRTKNVESKRAFGAKINAIADVAIEQMDDDEQRTIAALRVKWLAKQAQDLAFFFAVTSYDDQTTGGALEAWLPKSRLNRDGRPYRRISNLLHSPEFIRNKVAELHESRSFTADAHRVLGRADRYSCSHADYELIERWRQRIADERDIARRENDRAFWRERGCPIARYSLTTAEALKRRRVIKRAVRAAVRVLSAPVVSQFARGETVRLEGQTLDLIIERGGSVVGMGPHQLDITVAERGGKRLADLCLYIEGTPALDQLTGLALAMAAGEEQQIVRDANVIRAYPAGEGHPLLNGRIRAREQVVRHIDAAHVHRDAYIERTKRHWARELLRFAGAQRLEIAA
jgi:hypothetical protein